MMHYKNLYDLPHTLPEAMTIRVDIEIRKV